MGDGAAVALEVQKTLQLLAHDRGAQRGSFRDELQRRLWFLQGCWDVESAHSLMAVQQCVTQRLRALLAEVVARPGEDSKPFKLDCDKERYFFAVEVSFNVSLDYLRQLRALDLTRRRIWLAYSAPKDLRVSEKTARRYLADAIGQMVQIILDGDCTPQRFAPAEEALTQQRNPEPQSDEPPTQPVAEPEPSTDPQSAPPKPEPLFTSQATKALMREDWATPDDDVLGVLAFSNGKEAGAAWACEVLFHKWGTDVDGYPIELGNDMVRIERTMRLAKKRGINKEEMQKARRELALSGALVVDAGRYDLVDMGLSRYHEPLGINRKVRAFDDDHVVMREFQRLCLHSGRLDLAADWRDETVWKHGEDLAARTDRAVIDGVSCAVTMAGMQKASLAQLVNVHPIALLSISYVAEQVFRHGTTLERLTMAIGLLELITGSPTPATRGDRHHYLSQLLYDLREFEVSSLERPTLAEQLAVHVGSLPDAPPFNGEALLARTRLR